MIKDKLLELSAAQVVTVSAASTNVINGVAAGNAIGHELYIVCQVREAATAAGAGTVNFKIETSIDEAFTAPIVLFDSGAIGKAVLTLNAEPVKIKMPLGAKQFIRGYYTIGTGPLLTGKFDLFLTPDVDQK